MIVSLWKLGAVTTALTLSVSVQGLGLMAVTDRKLKVSESVCGRGCS